MQNECSQDNPPRAEAEPAPGEFDDLLRQIEKEPVPERLLALARQLQVALAHRRRLVAGDGVAADD